MKGKSDIFKFLFSLIAIISFFAFFLIFFKGNIYNRKFDIAPINPLTDNWFIINEDGSKEDIDFPLNLEIGQNETKTLGHVIDDSLTNYESPFIKLYLYYANLEVSVDGNVIFQVKAPSDGISNTIGVSDYLIPIPIRQAKKIMEFKFEGTIDGNFTYNFPVPYVGEKSDLYFSIINNFNLLNILNFFLISVAIILVIVSFLYRKTTSFKTLNSVGFFSLLGGNYLLFSSRWIHGIVFNTYLVYILEYSFFMTMIWPILIGIINISKGLINRLARILLSFGILLFIIAYIRLFFFKIELVTILKFSQLELFIAIIIVAAFAIKSYRDNNIIGKKYSIPFIPISVGVFVDLILYYLFRDPNYLTLFSQLGVIIYIVFQVMYAYGEYEKDRENKYRADIFKKIAYNDSLTGVMSRAAYSVELERIKENINVYSNLWVISVDVNDLKFINDNYGHASGDNLLKNVASILKMTTESNFVYRVGGDEFIIFLKNKSDEKVNQIMSNLKNNKVNYNNELNNISFAVGFSKYDSKKDSSFEDTIKRSDKGMYKNKKMLKN